MVRYAAASLWRAGCRPTTYALHGLIWRTIVRASALQRLTAACETHWMRHVSRRRRRARMMFDVHGHWQCAAETGTIYDVFTGSTRRRHGLTWAGAWWPGLLSRYTDSYAHCSRRVSEWVDTGQALQCWYHYDFDSTRRTRYDEHSAPFCTHSLAHHWCNCRPPVPTQAPNALHDRSTAGNVSQREPRTVCTASDINQPQMPPLRHVSSARTRRAFVHDIVRYMAATISYSERIRDRYRDIV